jgi:hypothetical protein
LESDILFIHQFRRVFTFSYPMMATLRGQGEAKSDSVLRRYYISSRSASVLLVPRHFELCHSDRHCWNGFTEIAFLSFECFEVSSRGKQLSLQANSSFRDAETIKWDFISKFGSIQRFP